MGREELAPRGIDVTAVHVGYMDTDMAAFAPADQKTDPAVVAELALDGLLAGQPGGSRRRSDARDEGATIRHPERSLTRSPAPPDQLLSHPTENVVERNNS